MFLKLCDAFWNQRSSAAALQEIHYLAVSTSERLIYPGPFFFGMAKPSERGPQRRIFEAAGVMGVRDLHLALHGGDEDWTGHLSKEELMTLGEMGIIVQEERSVLRRIKPPRGGVLLHPGD